MFFIEMSENQLDNFMCSQHILHLSRAVQDLDDLQQCTLIKEANVATDKAARTTVLTTNVSSFPPTSSNFKVG